MQKSAFLTEGASAGQFVIPAFLRLTLRRELRLERMMQKSALVTKAATGSSFVIPANLRLGQGLRLSLWLLLLLLMRK
jgi:hypothetical protein